MTVRHETPVHRIQTRYWTATRKYLGLLVVTASVLWVDVATADLLPLQIRDKGRTAVEVVRDVQIKDFRAFGVEGSRACHFRYKDAYFGYLDSETYYREKMPFGFMCYIVNDRIVGAGPVRFDETTGNWIPDLERYWRKAFVEEPTPAEKRKLRKATRFYDLSSVNAKGYAFTEEEITGDERGRRRMLSYCLIRQPKALCGDGNMGYVTDGAKADLTSYALEILRSIEFLDDPPPAPTADPASAASSSASGSARP